MFFEKNFRKQMVNLFIYSEIQIINVFHYHNFRSFFFRSLPISIKPVISQFTYRITLKKM